MTDRKRNVTLKDVSAASGVSLITVSRALRQPDTVQKATRAKVMKAIEDIGYVPNLTARALVSNRTDMIGVVVPILTSSLFADFAQGVAAVLTGRHVQMLLGVSDRRVDLEAEAVRTIVARQADAIIVTGFTHSDGCRRLLETFDGPVVETWNTRRTPVDLAVGYDNFGAAAEMTRYLISRGYREIAMVGGAFENNDQAVDRHAGFLSAMAEAGRSVRDGFVVSVPNPTTMDSGAAAMLRLMDGPVKPDAVFFQAEIPAHGAVMACMSRGISMPDDVAIAGFGDLSLSALLPVPLTTVRIRAREIGERSARMVLDRLTGRDGSARDRAGRVEDVGYDLMIRKSA